MGAHKIPSVPMVPDNSPLDERPGTIEGTGDKWEQNGELNKTESYRDQQQMGEMGEHFDGSKAYLEDESELI
ncbi:hypothetical protein ABES02_04395 [Neobacillus pocheonensis]|uniref:hypothetical protein n=1 Tax=Neobacillus pocheonensis TaxID=363869 RepID=UPI003D28C357